MDYMEYFDLTMQVLAALALFYFVKEFMYEMYKEFNERLKKESNK